MLLQVKAFHLTPPHPTFSLQQRGGFGCKNPPSCSPRGGFVQESALHVHLRGSLPRKGETQKSQISGGGKEKAVKCSYTYRQFLGVANTLWNS